MGMYPEARALFFCCRADFMEIPMLICKTGPRIRYTLDDLLSLGPR